MPSENVAAPMDATPAQVEEALRSGLAAGGMGLPPAVRLAKERNIDVLVERFRRVAFRRRLDQRLAEMRQVPYAQAQTSIGKVPFPAPPLGSILVSIERVRLEVAHMVEAEGAETE